MDVQLYSLPLGNNQSFSVFSPTHYISFSLINDFAKIMIFF